MTPDWRKTVREETAHPPTGARERIWAALRQAVPRRSLRVHPWVALAATCAATIAVGLVLWPKESGRTWITDGAVVLISPGAQVQYDRRNNEVTVLDGRMAASVWAGPRLRVSARGHVVDVEAAVTVIEVAADTVTVSPVDGWLVLDGERVDATEATRTRAGPTGLEALEPKDASLRRTGRLAELAVEHRQWDAAALALGEVAKTSSLEAEVALARKGEIELRRLNDPSQALATFDEAARRFPDGSLAQELELSALEAEVALGRFDAVQARAARFLARFPASERVDEVRRVSAAAGRRILKSSPLPPNH